MVPNASRFAIASSLLFCFLAACVVENGKPAPTPAPSTPTTPAEPATPSTPTTPPPAPPASCPDEASPQVTYTSKEPAVCARALFKCEPGQSGFSNQCGCGCIGEASGGPSCPDEAATGVSYKSKDGRKCAAMRFACAAGEKPFSSAQCGCGCEPQTGLKSECPDEASSQITYKSKSADECARMRFKCAATEKAFSSGECGCGCEPDLSKTPTTPPVAAKCPEASVAGVDYKSKDASFCARARIACPKGQKPFGSECGCGCVPL